MADVDGEKEKLADFLSKHFKLKPSLNERGLEVSTAEVSTFELARMVTKFVNSKGLNRTHWVNVQGNVVKLNRFNRQDKSKKNKNPVGPSTISHGW
jgi:hypothetical protein